MNFFPKIFDDHRWPWMGAMGSRRPRMKGLRRTVPLGYWQLITNCTTNHSCSIEEFLYARAEIPRIPKRGTCDPMHAHKTFEQFLKILCHKKK